MLPKISLIGRLTREPEIRYTQGGKPIVTFDVASSKRYKGADGQIKEDTCYLSVVCYGVVGERYIIPYAKKGSLVAINGELKLQQWVDRNNQKKSRHIVQVSDIEILNNNKATNNKAKNNSNQQYNNPPQQPQPQENYKKKVDTNPQEQFEYEIPSIDIDSEEIPF